MTKAVDFNTLLAAIDYDSAEQRRRFREWLDAYLPALPKVVVESTPFKMNAAQRYLYEHVFKANNDPPVRLVTVKSRYQVICAGGLPTPGRRLHGEVVDSINKTLREIFNGDYPTRPLGDRRYERLDHSVSNQVDKARRRYRSDSTRKR